MRRFLVCLAFTLLATQTSRACTNQQLSADYRTEFCQADVVFRGVPVGGMSSVAMTQEGHQMEGSVTTFRVIEYFKDNTGEERAQVRVGRRYTRGVDNCQAASFPGPADSFLVFGRGDRFLTVRSCGSDFPWECVPEDVQRALPYQC